MAEVDKKSIKDGFNNLSAGVDSGNESTAILPNQVHWAENVTFRGGYPNNRPGYAPMSIEYDSADIESWFKTKLFQGYGEYIPLNGKNHYYLYSVGGRIFKALVERDTFTIEEVTPFGSTATTTDYVSPPIGSSVTVAVTDDSDIIAGAKVTIGDMSYTVTSKTSNNVVLLSVSGESGILISSGTTVKFTDANSQYRPRAWFTQVDKWMVIQDGESGAILYDGNTARRARWGQNQELPNGTVMKVYRKRIWLAINGREFIAGDIVGGNSEPVQVTENTYLQGGGAFSIPPEAGEINSMAVLTSLDSAFGQGPLLVGTTKGFFSINAPADRDSWTNLTDPIQTPSVVTYGPVSDYATINVNGDLFYRAIDGVRTIAMARRDFGTWNNAPISAEMKRILERDDERLIKYSSAILFDNRFLFTTGTKPMANGKSAYFEAIGAIDFDSISRMIQRPTPIWEGIWTGLNTVMLMKGDFDGVERAFAIAQDENNENTIWEITKDDPFDGNEGRITSILELRSMEFRNPFELKSMEQFNLWTDNVYGVVDYSLKYRPDQYPCWFDWGSGKQICSQIKDCGTTACLTPQDFRPGYRTRLRWANPSESDETFDDKPAWLFYELNTRLEWVGRARIKKAVLKARLEQEEPHSGDIE